MPFVKGQPRHPNAGRKKGRKINYAITFRLSEEDFNNFKVICDNQGYMQAKILRNLVEDYIKQNKKYLSSEEVLESPEKVLENNK